MPVVGMVAMASGGSTRVLGGGCDEEEGRLGGRKKGSLSRVVKKIPERCSGSLPTYSPVNVYAVPCRPKNQLDANSGRPADSAETN